LQAKLERDRAEEEVFVEETGEEDSNNNLTSSTGQKSDGVESGEESPSDTAKPEDERPLDSPSESEAEEEAKAENNETSTEVSSLLYAQAAISMQLESEAEIVPKSENNETTTSVSHLSSSTKESANETTEDTGGDEEEGINSEREADQLLEPSTAVSFGGTITADHEQGGKAESEANMAIVENDRNADDDNDVIDVHVKCYSDFDPDKYARATGVIQGSEEEALQLTGLGIEQLSVFAREFSQK
jgi:hypothetical protein